MGLRITRLMGFLPANFQLATPFHSRLRVNRHGTADSHQRFMPLPYGGGGI